MQELNDRKKAILKSIIDSYISTGEPVGSKYLSGSGEINLSSATIRNEMSNLEEMGYLEQPHASSGRVPTASGYRMYINSLMERYLLSIEELRLLDDVFKHKMDRLGRLMEEASRALSRTTNYTSFAFINAEEGVAQRYETLYVDENNFLLIMICKDGTIRNRHIKTREAITPEMVSSAAQALNQTLTHVDADSIKLPHILAFEEKMSDYPSIASVILKVIYEMLNAGDSERVHVEGVTKLFSYPEFSNVSKARSVLEMLEERENLVNLLKEAVPEKNNIIIGDEQEHGLTPDTGMVIHPITSGNKVIGAVGVIGPKRMDYKKVIASLDYFVKGLTDTFNSGGTETAE